MMSGETTLMALKKSVYLLMATDFREWGAGYYSVVDRVNRIAFLGGVARRIMQFKMLHVVGDTFDGRNGLELFVVVVEDLHRRVVSANSFKDFEMGLGDGGVIALRWTEEKLEDTLFIILDNAGGVVIDHRGSCAIVVVHGGHYGDNGWGGKWRSDRLVEKFRESLRRNLEFDTVCYPR